MRCSRWIRFALVTTCLWAATFGCRDRDRSQPPTELAVPWVTPAAATEASLGEGLSIRRWQVTPDVAAYVARLDPKAWELVSVPAQQIGAGEGPVNGGTENDARAEAKAGLAGNDNAISPRASDSTTAAAPNPEASDTKTQRTTMDGANALPAVNGASGEREHRAPVSALATFVGATLAVNGGYFDEDGRVLGLRTTRARRFSALRQADWGVFSIANGKPSVRHTRDAGNVVSDFAVQCGPRLVVDGEPLTFKPGAHHRTAIGYDESDWVSVLVTIDPIELAELASALAKPSVQGGLGLVAALNLDGGPSTAMYVGGVHGADWSVPSPTPVADAVAVVPLGAALPWEVHGLETH